MGSGTMGSSPSGKINTLLTIAFTNWGRTEALFAAKGWQNPERMQLHVFVRRWNQLYHEGLAPETAEYLHDLVNLDALASRPELVMLVETRAAVDLIDAKHIFKHHEAMNKPGLDEKTRIRLTQTERNRKSEYRAKLMET